MFRFPRKNFKRTLINRTNFSANFISDDSNRKSKIDLPNQSDVVIIGGGSAGCYTLYNLAKRGVKAILLERFKLTAGTTWHTNGLMWRIRPNDTDILLLNRSRDIVLDIEKNTDFDPGWIQNGGIFIARNKTRLDEYKRLATIAKVYNIEHSMLSPDETLELFPLLNRNAFVGALFSPGDGIIDPTMLCSALTQLSTQTSNAKVIENCDVREILTEKTERGVPKIIGLRTEYGVIRTNCVVNATGVWGRDLLEPFGITLPMIPMKHSYIVSEPIKGIRGLPNIRDHDASIAFRIQGESIYLGGYEKNPILLDNVERDFSFGLYDLDWSTFNDHVEGAIELCPAFGEVGVKSTICGPETFTLDHKPIMGPDPRVIGLFHNCGFNSAGMMLGGGCGEQAAEWIIHGRPQYNMFNYDIRRFTQKQMTDKEYAKERSHEAYAENYAMVFAHAQPLAGRNLNKDPLHDELILNAGAVMEEKHGYERPAFFYKEKAPVNIPAYDWYGAYGHAINSDKTYLNILQGDQRYDFSDHRQRIGAEAMCCRTAAAVFNCCSFTKILIEGPDAKETLGWICTNDINKSPNSIIHTCALNSRGGVEAKFVVSVLEPGDYSFTDTKFDGIAFYIVADGPFTNHILAHINEAVHERGFDVVVKDLTNSTGIISVQGPRSKEIIQELTELSLDEIHLYEHRTTKVKGLESNVPVKLLPNRCLGEFGFDVHMSNKNCLNIYKQIFNIGSKYGVKDAGFRAYNSLSLENGTHQWGFDLRSDDTPHEANLQSLCRNDGIYQGKTAIDKQEKTGVNNRLVYLTLDEEVPLWGLEGVYRNGKPVGFLRRADFGYFINKSIGTAYIQRSDKNPIDMEYLMQASYQIDVLGKLYPACIDLESPKEHVKYNE